ncbi:MAG: hypothetical protein WBA74_19490 [Cyclobacteriaceae bacterium]
MKKFLFTAERKIELEKKAENVSEVKQTEQYSGVLSGLFWKKSKLIRIILLFSLFSCSDQFSERQQFLNELGTEKSASFELLTDSYERFLNTNFPNKSGVVEQSREFVIQLIEDREPFNSDSLNAIQVLTELERTELRKDIFLFFGESYEPTYDVEQFLPVREQVNIDLSEVENDFENLPSSDTIELSEKQKLINLEREDKQEEARKWYTYSNESGLYNYALAKVFESDTSFLSYCEIRYYGLSPALTPELTELELWKNQLPLIVDFYFLAILRRYGKYVIKDPNRR